MRKLFYYLFPLYWPLWLLVGLLWLLIQLPYRWQLSMGKMLGLLIMVLSKKAKRVATINLKLCFPELSTTERTKLCRDTFISVGTALFETGLAFWASDKRLSHLVHIKNLSYYTEALASGRGVLLLGAHYTTIEIIGRACAPFHSFAVMYAPNKIAILDFIIRRALEKHYTHAIPRNNMRTMLKTLLAGKAVWYSADVNSGRKHSLFAPFFNIPAATNKAPMRLAKLSNCVVIPLIHFRHADGSGYTVELLEPLADFPSIDQVADATRINQIIEQTVREHPDQYLWTYMRFKTRPNHKKMIYQVDSPVLDPNFKNNQVI